MEAYLEEGVDVEEEFLKDREGMQMRYGGPGVEDDDDPFAGLKDEAEEMEEEPAVGSAGRGTRDQW